MKRNKKVHASDVLWCQRERELCFTGTIMLRFYSVEEYFVQAQKAFEESPHYDPSLRIATRQEQQHQMMDLFAGSFRELWVQNYGQSEVDLCNFSPSGQASEQFNGFGSFLSMKYYSISSPT